MPHFPALQHRRWPDEDAAALAWPAPDTLHLWWIDTPAADGLELDFEPLNAAECTRAQALQRPEIRAAFVARRGAIRRVLARYLGTPPENVPLATTSTGAPRLALDAAPAISISHTAGISLLALGPHATGLGVDIETRARKTDAAGIARRFFHEAERAALAAGAVDFFAVWTRKEALVKAAGVGLNTELAALNTLACANQTTPVDLPLLQRLGWLRDLAPQDYETMLDNPASICAAICSTQGPM